MLLAELGTAPHREITTMARHTRIKLAALATTFVAALGVVAVAPATASIAGGTHVTNAKTGGEHGWCC